MWERKQRKNKKQIEGISAWWNTDLQFLSHTQIIEGITISTNTAFY